MLNSLLLKHKINIAAALVVAIFFLIDRLLKLTAIKIAPLSIPLIKEILSFNLATNKNIAFSLPLSGPWLNWPIVIIIFYFLWLLWQIKNDASRLKEKIAICLIAGGALSNLIDRLQYGHVIDYLRLKYFTIFNLADVMIVTGSLLLAWQILKKQ